MLIHFMNKEINYHFNLKIFQGNAPYLGKGRVQLLEGIVEYGSIAQAAKAMGMSYRKAWQLVKNMNQAAATPLVEKQLGGKAGGGTKVTEAGRLTIEKYHLLREKMEQFLAETSKDLDWNLNH